MAPPTPGVLYAVGLGPGDPELMTLKAARIIEHALVIAFFARRGKLGHARSMVEGRINPAAEELRLQYPITTEIPVPDPRYAIALAAFYEAAAAEIAMRLDGGQDVALLCEGDPYFYGSSLAILDRLGGIYPTEVVPGVTGMSGCWTRAGTPMVSGDDVLTVLPGTLDEDRLVDRLSTSDAAVIMKVGRNRAKIHAALRRAGRLEQAIYVERGTMSGERIAPFTQVDGDMAPYFSLVLVPGRKRAR
jgi:precorrin-2/cobalt-factor-2 C20-methyltransferase